MDALPWYDELTPDELYIRNWRWFEERLKMLRSSAAGQYVAIVGERVIAQSECVRALRQKLAAQAMDGGETFYGFVEPEAA